MHWRGSGRWLVRDVAYNSDCSGKRAGGFRREHPDRVERRASEG
jgi:hypothetical protein